VNLTALGIGAVIGAGIFVLTGQAAAKYAGPAIVFSFVLAGLACASRPACVYAEFSAMIPISGSAYTYGYVDAGRIRRLDHRLGFDSRIFVRRLHVAVGLVGRYVDVFSSGAGNHHPGRLHFRALHPRDTARRAVVEHLAAVHGKAG